MLRQAFRIDLPIVALRIEDGRQVCITIPAGSMIYVQTKGNLSGGSLVNVTYDGAAAMMFAVDVLKRGTRINAAHA